MNDLKTLEAELSTMQADKQARLEKINALRRELRAISHRQLKHAASEADDRQELELRPELISLEAERIKADRQSAEIRRQMDDLRVRSARLDIEIAGHQGELTLYAERIREVQKQLDFWAAMPAKTQAKIDALRRQKAVLEGVAAEVDR